MDESLTELFYLANGPAILLLLVQQQTAEATDAAPADIRKHTNSKLWTTQLKQKSENNCSMLRRLFKPFECPPEKIRALQASNSLRSLQ